MALSPEGNRVACGGYGTVTVLDASTGESMLTFTGHTLKTGERLKVFSVAYSPDGRRLVTAGQEVKIWDALTGAETFTLRGHSNVVECVVFSPNGKRVISGSADGTVKVWDCATGDNILTLSGHVNPVVSVALSPDGMLVSLAREIKVWRASLSPSNGSSGRVANARGITTDK